LPAFYHVHNGQSERFPAVNPHVVNANLDFPPQRPPERPCVIRNGDFRTVYARFYEVIDNLLNNLEEQEIQIPHASLKGHPNYDDPKVLCPKYVLDFLENAKT
jgi:hypothetical protein